LDRRFILQWHLKKEMENMEFLKAMLAKAVADQGEGKAERKGD
jgi:hypothetical protein